MGFHIDPKENGGYRVRSDAEVHAEHATNSRNQIAGCGCLVVLGILTAIWAVVYSTLIALVRDHRVLSICIMVLCVAVLLLLLCVWVQQEVENQMDSDARLGFAILILPLLGVAVLLGRLLWS
jgi:hypothetical protein